MKPISDDKVAELKAYQHGRGIDPREIDMLFARIESDADARKKDAALIRVLARVAEVYVGQCDMRDDHCPVCGPLKRFLGERGLKLWELAEGGGA